MRRRRSCLFISFFISLSLSIPSECFCIQDSRIPCPKQAATAKAESVYILYEYFWRQNILLCVRIEMCACIWTYIWIFGAAGRLCVCAFVPIFRALEYRETNITSFVQYSKQNGSSANKLLKIYIAANMAQSWLQASKNKQYYELRPWRRFSYGCCCMAYILGK